jgi:Leucine-rich repeat (LRR) protein
MEVPQSPPCATSRTNVRTLCRRRYVVVGRWKRWTIPGAVIIGVAWATTAWIAVRRHRYAVLERYGTVTGQVIDFAFSEVDDRSLERLNGMPGLRTVNLSDCARVTDSGFSWVKNTPKLAELCVRGCRLSGQFLEYIPSTVCLDTLAVDRTGVTDSSMMRLKCALHLRVFQASESLVGLDGTWLDKCQNIERLELAGTRVDDNFVCHIARCRHVTHLVLASCMVTDTGLGGLAALPRLQYLDLSGTLVTDSGIEQLKDAKNLEALVLTDTKISDASISHLGQLNKLTYLGLKNTLITDEGRMRLQAAHPKLRIER